MKVDVSEMLRNEEELIKAIFNSTDILSDDQLINILSLAKGNQDDFREKAESNDLSLKKIEQYINTL